LKLKPTAVAVVGGKKSGKTITIEVLTRGLTKRRYRVAVAKHIPEPKFTIDTEGKDTWRFAQAGARTIIGVSSDEVVTIEKVRVKNYSLGSILKKGKDSDVIFLEGFRKQISRKLDIPKIVIVRSADEASEALRSFVPILVFTGSYSTESLNSNIPYLDVARDPEKIVDIVEKVVIENSS